jgi:hypothetical protein
MTRLKVSGHIVCEASLDAESQIITILYISDPTALGVAPRWLEQGPVLSRRTA